MKRKLGRSTPPSKFLTRGHCPPQLLGNGRGDRLRSGPDRPRGICGAAIEAEAGPRLWPELAPEPKEKLQATQAEVLNNEVHHHPRSLNTSAGWREDRQTRGGMQPQRMPHHRTLGRLPKLMLGKAPLECRADPLLARDRAEANG